MLLPVFSLHYLYMMPSILDDIFTRTGVIMNPAKRKGYEEIWVIYGSAPLWLEESVCI